MTGHPAALRKRLPSIARRREFVRCIAADSTNILITCVGVPGRIHRLLSATELAPGAVWTAVATNTLSGAGTVVWTLPVPTNGAAYYRAATP